MWTPRSSISKMFIMLLSRWTSVLLLLWLIPSIHGMTIPDLVDTNHWLHSRHSRAIPSGRGQASETSTCDVITTVPDDVRTTLDLDDFYQKYTDAYGIHILSSPQVSDDALHRACYDVRFLLADRKDVRDAIYDGHGRVAVIGINELTTDVPEHSFLDDLWNERARGFGGTLRIPVTSGSEENLLCLGQGQDRWYEEDLLIHEFAHAIHLTGMNRVNDTFEERLQKAYNDASAKGLWKYTYASADIKEYFAEGVQKFFNVDVHRGFIDGVHNTISTRESLRGYDSGLYNLVSEVFPCGNDVVKRCQNQTLISSQDIRMNCELGDGKTTTTPQMTTVAGATSSDTATAGRSTESPDATAANVTAISPTTKELDVTGDNGASRTKFQGNVVLLFTILVVFMA